MASILKRTIFFDNSHNQIRFFPWNLVTTTLGTMVEPRQLDRAGSSSPDWTDYDPQDELAKVDEMIPIDILRQKDTILGSGQVIHGGEQLPRSYHYNPVN